LGATVTIVNGDSLKCYLATLQGSSPTGDEAGLSACSAALAGNPANRAEILVNRSDIRLRMGDFQGAITDCEEAIAIEPRLAEAHLNRGAGLVGLQFYDRAIAALDLAIELGPQKAEIAYFNRGLARGGQGDIQGAYQDFQKALELNPKFQPAIRELAQFSDTKY
jgi:tetratricopeptide (TPR) repeat protein